MPDPLDNTPAGPGRRLDHWASAFAVALSLAALFVSFAEVSSERAQQRASVWPYIEIGESYSSEGFTLRLKNKGVGPALMGKLVLTFDNAPVTDLDQLIVDTIGTEKAFGYERYGLSDPSNSVVAPGETVRLFAVDWDASSRQLIQAWNGRIDVESCYCAIHGDCWRTALSSQVNQPTDTCQTGVSP